MKAPFSDEQDRALRRIIGARYDDNARAQLGAIVRACRDTPPLGHDECQVLSREAGLLESRLDHFRRILERAEGTGLGGFWLDDAFRGWSRSWALGLFVDDLAEHLEALRDSRARLGAAFFSKSGRRRGGRPLRDDAERLLCEVATFLEAKGVRLTAAVAYDGRRSSRRRGAVFHRVAAIVAESSGRSLPAAPARALRRALEYVRARSAASAGRPRRS